MMKFYESILASVVNVFFLAAALVVIPTAHATLYWDATSGTLAGTGTWDTATTNWSTSSSGGGTHIAWSPNDGTQDATFGGNPGAGGSGLGGANGKVTVGGTINVKSITFQPTAGNYSIYGGTLNFTSPTGSFVMNANTSGASRQQIIGSVIGGSNIAVVSGNGGVGINSFLTIGGDGTGVTNTFTGDLIFEGPNTATQGFLQIGINNPTALPTTATVRMRRNLSQLLFSGGGAGGSSGYTATFNNNIILNDGGSNTVDQSIGTFNASYNITLGGVISGNNANLIFQLGSGGGNGLITLTNHSTYSGSTQLNSNTAETIRLGISDAFPVGTTLILNRGSSFDMAGFNQRVGGLTTTGAAAADITNSGGSQSTLTVDGNVTGKYLGNLGASSSNIALVLAPTNTGTLTLSRSFGNSYTGGTTINGGKLIATGLAAASETGTGPVAVNNGGTLGGGSGAGDVSTGPISINSGGHVAPSNEFNNGTSQQTGAIGTLTVFGSLSLANGSRLDMDLGAPVFGASGSSDQVNMPNATALTVPAAASSVGVNFGNPSGLGGNGTYTLMTFQAGQYTGSSNAGQFFTASVPSPNNINGATVAYHLADGSNNIVDGTPASATRVIAVVTGGPNQLTWTGSNGTAWDTGLTANFTSATTGTSSLFAGNDNVLFDDSAGANTTVAVAAGGVQPNMVAINNSSGTYTFSGGDIKGSSVGGGGALFLSGTGNVTINNNYTAPGPITYNKSGTAVTTINGNITAASGLTVSGGKLTLTGANTYTGSNTITAGTLSIAADNNLGAAPGSPTANSITMGSGTLQTTGTFTLNSNRGISTTAGVSAIISNDPGTTLTYGGVISGSGGVTQTGTGKLVLSGASTYTGNTTIKASSTGVNSTLAIGADNALPTATQLNINGVINGGNATFDLNGFNQTVAGIALIQNAPTVTTAGGTITNSAGGAAKNFTVTNSSSSFAGTISGNLNLIKNGTDTLALTGANTYTGDTKDLAGKLSISTPYLANAADVYLATGSTFGLDFASALTDTIRSLYIDNVLQPSGTWGAVGSGAAHTSSLLSGIGLLSVTTGGVAGDYNNDGKVDAGDYVMWRKTPGAFGGDPGGYNTWRANFGNGGPGSGSGLGGSAAVPEPGSCAMLLMGCAVVLCIRRDRSGGAAA